MEIKNKLTVTRGEREGGQWGKEGEGSSQGTFVKDPWTKTTGAGLNVGGEVGRAEENNGGKMGTIVTENK